MVTALVLSGGSGSRAGTDVPKQYICVNGKPLILYCLEVLSRHPRIDAVQIVAAPQWQEVLINNIRNAGLEEKLRGFSLPGETRQLSILQGLRDIRRYADDRDVVLVHYAARPNLSPEMITSCIEGMDGYDGLMPVLPMKDTVYVSYHGDRVDELLKREQVVAGQAPELFVLGKYYEANQCLLPDRILDIKGSTEPAILAGMKIAIIPGDENNYKITTAADLKRFEKSILEREGQKM